METKFPEIMSIQDETFREISRTALKRTDFPGHQGREYA